MSQATQSNFLSSRVTASAAGLLILALTVGINASVAQPLQAGITENTTIGPMSAPLQAGATFDEHNLPPLHTRTGWYEIPRWAAGYWHRENQTDKVGFRTITHPSRRDRLRGDQVDRTGRIWQAHDEPNVVTVDTGSTIDYILDKSTEPVQITESLMVIHYIGSDIIVDKATRRIVRSGMREETQRITQAPGGGLACSSDLKNFDQSGQKIRTVSGTWTESLLRPFTPLDYSNGRNYFQDFCQFLHSVGQDASIPERAYPPQAQQQQQQAPPQQYQQYQQAPQPQQYQQAPQQTMPQTQFQPVPQPQPRY